MKLPKHGNSSTVDLTVQRSNRRATALPLSDNKSLTYGGGCLGRRQIGTVSHGEDVGIAHVLTRLLVDVNVSRLVRHLAVPQDTGRGTWRSHVQHLVLKEQIVIRQFQMLNLAYESIHFVLKQISMCLFECYKTHATENPSFRE